MSVHDEPKHGSWREALFVGVLLVTAIWFVYGQVLGFSFVDFDDDRRLLRNPHVVSGLTLEGIAWAFTSVWDANWSPLTWISHMADFHLYGGYSPGGHHLTNVILHVMNSLLLFGLFRSATGSTWRSSIVAGLFAVHPMHVETVAWISERKGLLSAFFGLISIWSYVGYAKSTRDTESISSQDGSNRAWYWVSALCLGLGLMAKGMLVTFPVLFLLLDVWPLRRFGPEDDAASPDPRPSLPSQFTRLAIEKWPFVAIVLVAALITYVAQRSGGAVIQWEGLPFHDRLKNAVVSYVLYLWKLIWPTRLAIGYPHPNLPGQVPWSFRQVLASATFLAAITVAALRARRHRYLAVGWLWYLITLLPVIGLIQLGELAMADRYAYLPFIGIYIAVTWTVADAVAQRCTKSAAWRATRAMAAIIPFFVYTVAAQAQTTHWRNSIALFQHAITVTSGNFLMHYNLGNVLKNLGRFDDAIEQYEMAIKIYPQMNRAHLNLGNTLVEQGRIDEAIAHYRLVEKGSAPYELTRVALGRAVMATNDPNLAVDYWRAEVDRHPDRAENHANLGDALRLTGDIETAIAEYERAVTLDGSDNRWQQVLGEARAAAGKD